jgi:hypothetical protein
LSTHEIPPKLRTPLPGLSGFRQANPCGGTEVAAEFWLAVGLSWPGGTKKGAPLRDEEQAPLCHYPLKGIRLTSAWGNGDFEIIGTDRLG